MRIAVAVRTGALNLFLACFVCFVPPPVSAASVLLGSGSLSNHLLILFAPGQILEIELCHNGTIQTGEQLLAAVIQSSGGKSVITPANDSEGNPFLFLDQKSNWDGRGLFAHFYDYGWGVFVNGFAWESFSAWADGSWDSYFVYQIGGAEAAYTLAPVGAKDRVLTQGDHDAYVLSSTHPSPGLAAWKATHGITDLQKDPDGDGMVNLVEYALRRHPLYPDPTGAILVGQIQTNHTRFHTLTYRRPHDFYAEVPPGADAAYDGVIYTVETSTNLVTWQSGTNHITQTVTPDPTGPMATVIARVPADSPRRFLRLRIFLP